MKRKKQVSIKWNWFSRHRLSNQNKQVDVFFFRLKNGEVPKQTTTTTKHLALLEPGETLLLKSYIFFKYYRSYRRIVLLYYLDRPYGLSLRSDYSHYSVVYYGLSFKMMLLTQVEILASRWNRCIVLEKKLL